jgi:MarR-like DNA-binding transcriptional regulator SgrR of sgrS sRNA
MSLKIISVENRVATSFLPEEGDVVPNAVKLEQIIGTLVKETQGNSGTSEPYLASAWSISNDKKTYRFEFRQGLVCEDGSEINGESFRRSLIRLLKTRAATFEIPVFSQLVGWQEFVVGKHDLIGLRSEQEGRRITFEFVAPVSGLLEFLAMPQFGHYCDANYNDEGHWADPLRVISSGPYRVQSADTHQVTLVQRRDWLLARNTAPSKVEFINSPWPPAEIDPHQPTAVLIRAPNGDEQLSSFVRVDGAPLFLNALVLSPFKAGPFSNEQYRKSFAQRFSEKVHNRPDRKTPSIYERSFYLGNRELRFSAPHTKPTGASGPVRILQMNSGSGVDVAHMEQAITTLLEEDGLRYEIVPFERSPGFIKRAFSNREFDIRLARVDVGFAPQTWVLDMMFCSQLGISFPDPSRRICSEVASLRTRHITHPTTSDMEPILSSIEEDASVIPAYHSGAMWFFSKHLDLTNISNHLVVPRVELLELR